MATVRLFRPDLFTNEVDQQEGHPILKEMPPHFLDKHVPHIEGIGEPITATFFTHSMIDPTNWFAPSLFGLITGSCSLLTILHPPLVCDEKVDVGEI